MKTLKLLSPKEESERDSHGGKSRTATERALHNAECRIEAMLITIARLVLQTTRTIMSAISDYAAKQKAFNDRQAAAIDGLVASVSGVTGDVQALNDKITELQNSVGGVTPEDQALIDQLESQGSDLTTKLEGVQTALAALDAQTPPVVPPV